MALIKSVTANTIDTAQVSVGDCIRAKRTSWTDFLNGFVTEVDSDKVVCLYSTESASAVNYFTIPADEVAAGMWQIYWTADFITIKSEGVDPQP